MHEKRRLIIPLAGPKTPKGRGKVYVAGSVLRGGEKTRKTLEKKKDSSLKDRDNGAKQRPHLKKRVSRLFFNKEHHRLRIQTESSRIEKRSLSFTKPNLRPPGKKVLPRTRIRNLEPGKKTVCPGQDQPKKKTKKKKGRKREQYCLCVGRETAIGERKHHDTWTQKEQTVSVTRGKREERLSPHFKKRNALQPRKKISGRRLKSSSREGGKNLGQWEEGEAMPKQGLKDDKKRGFDE